MYVAGQAILECWVKNEWYATSNSKKKKKKKKKEKKKKNKKKRSF